MSIERRKRVGGFAYSLGSYPVQDFPQEEGYSVGAAQVDEAGGARFEYEVTISLDRLIDLMLRITALLPDEVFLIFESYPNGSSRRRVYLTDSTHPRREFMACLRRYTRLWKDEGFVSFGAFSYDPPVEMFLNEHKTVTIYTPFAETTEEILADFGLRRLDVLEIYYSNVEHVHSSVAELGPDGETLLMREMVESDLFSAFDFFDQTPMSCGEEHGVEPVEGQDADSVEEGLLSFRCDVHGKLVVAPGGRPREFHQIFCVAAQDEGAAADWVRESMRRSNARMVRVREIEPVEPSAVDPSLVPDDGGVEEGVWYESERVFLSDVS